MQMELYKLKPCPFCGSNAELLETTYKMPPESIPEYKDRCKACHANVYKVAYTVSKEYAKQSAIENWNYRV